MNALKTKEERDAAIAKVFANLIPADLRVPTVVEMLKPYRAQLLQKRKEGFSLQQMVEAIKQDPIGINTSTVTLRRVLGVRAKARKKAKGPVVLRAVIPIGNATNPAK